MTIVKFVPRGECSCGRWGAWCFAHDGLFAVVEILDGTEWDAAQEVVADGGSRVSWYATEEEALASAEMQPPEDW